MLEQYEDHGSASAGGGGVVNQVVGVCCWQRSQGACALCTWSGYCTLHMLSPSLSVCTDKQWMVFYYIVFTLCKCRLKLCSKWECYLRKPMKIDF